MGHSFPEQSLQSELSGRRPESSGTVIALPFPDTGINCNMWHQVPDILIVEFYFPVTIKSGTSEVFTKIACKKQYENYYFMDMTHMHIL